MTDISKNAELQQSCITAVSRRSFRIGELVEFNIISDDSDYASNCFGIEAQNDWFDVQVYSENVFGEIVKTNTIEIIYSDGKRSGRLFKIKKGIIESEVNKLYQKKYQYDLKLKDIFDGSNFNSVKSFKEIKILPCLKLSSNKIFINGKVFVEYSGF